MLRCDKQQTTNKQTTTKKAQSTNNRTQYIPQINKSAYVQLPIHRQVLVGLQPPPPQHQSTLRAEGGNSASSRRRTNQCPLPLCNLQSFFHPNFHQRAQSSLCLGCDGKRFLVWRLTVNRRSDEQCPKSLAPLTTAPARVAAQCQGVHKFSPSDFFALKNSLITPWFLT